MFQFPVQITQKTIQQLLGATEYEVPTLQRPYAWKRRHAEDLVTDLTAMVKYYEGHGSLPLHFFGMIVTVSPAMADRQIIDGQQRLTTITAFLAHLQTELNRLIGDIEILVGKSPEEVAKAHLTNVKNLASEHASQIRSLLWRPGQIIGTETVHQPKINVSPEIRKLYRALLEGTSESIPDSELKKPAKTLRSNAELLVQKIIEPAKLRRLEPKTQLDTLVRLKDIICAGLIIAHLDSGNAEGAFDLFESLNARGEPLNELNLINTWILSEFAAEGLDTSKLAETMHSMMSDDETQQLKFFRDFCILRSTLKTTEANQSRMADIFKPTNGNVVLAKNARAYVFRDEKASGHPAAGKLTDRIAHEVEEMAALSPIWDDLQSGQDRTPATFKGSSHHQQIRTSIGNTVDQKSLKLQQSGPYFMHWANHFASSPKLFAQLVSDFERFFFRYRTVCGNTEKRVKDVLITCTTKLDTSSKNGDLGQSLQLMQDVLASAAAADAPDTDFKANFHYKVNYKKSAAARYFLYRMALESWKPPYSVDTGLVLVHSDKGPGGEMWTLEHISPQNPDGTAPLDDEQLHSIGNLCLLNPKVNSSLSNGTFAEKKAKANKIKKEQYITVMDSAQIFYDGPEQWGPTEIKQREDALVQKALKIFSF